jgi:hypothetical protein
MRALRLAITILLFSSACRTPLLTDDGGSGGSPVSDGGRDLAGLDAGPCDAAVQVVTGTPSPGAIACNANGSCMLGSNDVCCSNFDTPPFDKTCSQGMCPMGFSTFACDGPEDCPGAICCFAGDTVKGNATCKLPCEGRVVCHKTSDCPSTLECLTHFGFPDGTGLCALPGC